ncbi:MAG: hypothetical protein PVG75_14510 [Thioalkalispiraceae bacterium]
MVTHILFQLRMIALSIVASLLVWGCVYDPVYHGPPAYGYYHPHYYDYYYYPSARVYFRFSTGFYFYFTNGHWVRTRILPPHIHIDPYDRVRIRVKTDKPYLYHDQHKSRFKPRPTYRVDERKTRSLKEREANREWYKEYQRNQKPPKQNKGKKDKDKK